MVHRATKLAGMVFLVCVLMLALAPVGAEIYKWVDGNGRIHFTDQPPAGQDAEQVSVRINTYTSPEVSPLDSRVAAGGKVVMYSASWCSACQQAKDYFEAQGIPYTEYDVEKSNKGKRDFKKLGGKGVPVILVGNTRINGFSRHAFEQAYYP